MALSYFFFSILENGPFFFPKIAIKRFCHSLDDIRAVEGASSESIFQKNC